MKARANKFFGFLYRVILSRTLGSEGMGIYQLALSVFAVLVTVTSSGIPLTVSRLITKHRTRGDAKAEHSTVTAAIVAVLIFSVPGTPMARAISRYFSPVAGALYSITVGRMMAFATP